MSCMGRLRPKGVPPLHLQYTKGFGNFVDLVYQQAPKIHFKEKDITAKSKY